MILPAATPSDGWNEGKVMMLRPTSRRAGASLVEVLVGFGILGIGVTSVITLFPFSALTLGQALKDDRTTTCAAMADGQMRDIHQRFVVDPEEDKAKKIGTGSLEDYFGRFRNPGIPGTTPLVLGERGPSYPVYVDPMGWYARGGVLTSVGDNGTPTGIPRVNITGKLLSTDLGLIQGEAVALRYCSLMDSLSFDEDGQVDTTGASMRELRYNYAWMLQRPADNDPLTVRMQIVVYNRRAHLYAPPGSEAVISGVIFTPGETTITNVPESTDIRKGMWVLDATTGPDDGGRQLRHGEFYRVTSVTKVGTTYSLEVHKPVSRADGLIDPVNPLTYRYSNGTLVVIPGIADVFERPMLTAKH